MQWKKFIAAMRKRACVNENTMEIMHFCTVEIQKCLFARKCNGNNENPLHCIVSLC